jgi:predicted glycosyltransferase
MRIARAIVTGNGDARVLIATGSPQAGSFTLPEGVDIVRLPAVTKDETGGYRSRTLGLPIDATVSIRSAVFGAAIQAFRPDCLLVDHAPAGLNGEIMPVLTGPLRPSRVVLGLRDIIDDPLAVAADWSRKNVWDVLRDVYDDIFVYGDELVCSTARELGLQHRVGARVTHVGYVTSPLMHTAAERSDLPHIVVTAGGGGDGAPVMERFIDFVAKQRPHIRVTIVTGPLLSERRRARVAAATSGLPNVTVQRFVPKMERLLAEADGVISMAGYNSVAELLAAGTPAFLFPRTHPRLEQWIRATRLAPHAPFDIGLVDAVQPEDFSAWIDRCRTHTRRPSPLSLHGAREAAALLNSRPATGRPALAEFVS